MSWGESGFISDFACNNVATTTLQLVLLPASVTGGATILTLIRFNPCKGNKDTQE